MLRKYDFMNDRGTAHALTTNLAEKWDLVNSILGEQNVSTLNLYYINRLQGFCQIIKN